MKEIISLERNKIKLKGNGQKIVIPLEPKEGKPWVEVWDEDVEAKKLYQIMQEDKDNVEPNDSREIL